MMRIVMLICFLPVPVIMGVMQINETKFKKNIALGVTMPYEARTDEGVQHILKVFKNQTVCLTALLTSGLLLCFTVKGDMGFMQAMMCWLLPVITLPYVPYIFWNRKLRALKKSRGWGFENPDVISVDTSSIPQIKWLSPLWFLLAFVLSLLPLIWDRTMTVLYIIGAACIILFWIFYRWLYRQKAEKVDDNASLTDALSRIRKRNWGRMWLISAWSMTALNIGTWLLAEQPTAFIVLIIVFVLTVSAAAIGVEMSTRAAQEKLSRESGKGTYLDDDDKWIWGLFYYNPSDFKSFVNNRVGSGMTLNLARPAGKAFMALALIIILSIPFILPLTNSVLDKPPVMEISGDTLTASSGGTEYKIELESIKSAGLLDELPDKLVKISGTGIEKLLKGRFSSADTGAANLCLDPTQGPYILIELQSGDKFIFGTRDSEETENIFKSIK